METKIWFHKMLDQLPCGIGLYEEDAAGRAIYLNDAFFKLIGYTREEYEAMVHRPLDSYVYQADRWIYEENVRKMQEQGFVTDCEYRIIRSDGTVRWIQLNISKIPVDNRMVNFASFTDITKAKEAELASAYAEDRFRLVLETTNTAVFEWNAQKKICYGSELFQHYNLAALPVKDSLEEWEFQNAIHPEDLPSFWTFVQAAKAHKTKSECVLRLRMTDGSYRWSCLVCLLDFDENGTFLRAVGAIVDRNEEMEKGAIQRELMAAIPGGVAVFKVGEKIQCLYYNEALTPREHHTQEELQALFDGDNVVEDIIAPEDKERFVTEVMEKARKGLPINVTCRYIRRGETRPGQAEWIHLTATKIREEDGCPVYYAVMTAPPQENMLYRGIVEDSMTAAVVMEQRTGNILFANHAFRQMLGRDGGAGLTGKSPREVLLPEVAHELTRQAVLLTEDRLREDMLQTDDGRFLLVKGKKLAWNGLRACLFYLLDQTALQKRNHALVKLLDDIPGGIGISELKNNRMVQRYLNEGFFRMLGTTREGMCDFNEQRHAQAIHPDDIPVFTEAVNRLNHGEQHIDVTYRMKNKEQKDIWLRMMGNVKRLEDGQTVLYCSYFDVDQQMKNQLTLDNERTILQLAMQTAKMSSWEYDLATKSIHQAETSQIQHGYGRVVEQAPESLIADDFVHPDSVAAYRSLFRPVTKEEGVLRSDVCVRTPDRKGYWWERIIMTPVFDRNGTHIRSIGTTIDLTDQKAMEAKYKQQVQIFNAADSPDLIAKGLYNLNKNLVDYYHGESDHAIKMPSVHSYSAGLDTAAALFASDHEAEKFLRQFDRHALLRQFKTGNGEVVCEYQRKTGGGKMIWAKTAGKLYREPSSGDIMCFIYSYDIDEKKDDAGNDRHGRQGGLRLSGVIGLPHRELYCVFQQEKKQRTAAPVPRIRLRA